MCESPPPRKCCKKSRFRESEVQFVEDRIDLVKDFFGCLCYEFGSYARRIGSIRDKGDELAKLMMTYGDTECLHSTMKSSLLQFAAILGAIQDCRQVLICRLENKLIPILSKYEEICRYAKADISVAMRSKRKKSRLKEKLMKMKAKFQSSDKDKEIEEGRLEQISLEVSRCMKALKRLIIEFEERKLCDLQKILLSFVKIEMIFHAKALELYANAWPAAMHINTKADMEELLVFMHKQADSWKAASSQDKNDELEMLLGPVCEIPTPTSEESSSLSEDDTLEDESSKGCFSGSLCRKPKPKERDKTKRKRRHPKSRKPEVCSSKEEIYPCKKASDASVRTWMNREIDEIMKSLCDDTMTTTSSYE